MNNQNKNEYIFKGKAKGPINIAIIKYWGKDDEELITPLNNSISLTLDMNKFYTETEVTIESFKSENIIPIEKNLENITLLLNGQNYPVSTRIKNVFKKFLSINYPICKEISTQKLNIKIESKNTFPTASGCASSASSMSALVCSISSALKLENLLTKKDLSKIARIGSGSACRSIFGGVAEWIKDGGDDSHAVPLYNNTYWDLGVKLIIISQNEKEVSSSKGMKITKETSELFQYRINHIVDKHIAKVKECLKKKNFNELAEVVIKDSNNFHACCRDSYPTINYLNEESEYIMKGIMLLNKIMKNNICAYTFDAGSNAFIIYEKVNKHIIDEYFNLILGLTNISIDDFLNIVNIKNNQEVKTLISSLVNKKPEKEKILQQVDFSLGEGAIIINY